MGSILSRVRKKYNYVRPQIWLRYQVSWSFLRDRIVRRQLVDATKIEAFDKVVFLFPRFMYLEAIFETSDEIIQSFREYSPRAEIHIIFYDVENLKGNTTAIKDKLLALNPSHIVYMYGPNPTFSLSPEEMREFLCHFEAVKIIIFTDIVRFSHLYFLYKLRFLFDIVVALDTSIPFRSANVADIGPVVGCLSKKSFTEVVEPKLSQKRDIDLLILGTMYTERRRIIDKLRSENIEAVSSGGGYDSKRLSFDEYFSLSARAKIRVVTSFTEERREQFNSNSAQLKAHIMEAIASRSLLFVDSAFPTSNFLEGGADFIYFSDMDDLLEKSKYYLENESERERIAGSAHEKWRRSYMGGRFWGYIVENALNSVSVVRKADG